MAARGGALDQFGALGHEDDNQALAAIAPNTRLTGGSGEGFEAREPLPELEELCVAAGGLFEEQRAREGAGGEFGEEVQAEGEQGEGGEDAEEGEVARRVHQKPW